MNTEMARRVRVREVEREKKKNHKMTMKDVVQSLLSAKVKSYRKRFSMQIDTFLQCIHKQNPTKK